MKEKKRNAVTLFALLGTVLVTLILIVGTIKSGQTARSETEAAVRSVSLLYLEELAGRREQVVENNLASTIDSAQLAIEMMTREDLQDAKHLQTYQSRMKQLFHMDRFALADTEGRLYTADGVQADIGEYSLELQNLSEPEISVRGAGTATSTVVIAVPIDRVHFSGRELTCCLLEIDMDQMLQGVSMRSQDNTSTFCNLYTSDGTALTNTVLGGLAVEDNLLQAMANAEYKDGYSLEKMTEDFRTGTRGVVSFIYDGIHETLSYVPVKGTDWLLTYLIREDVITERINPVSSAIIRRSLAQSLLTALVLMGLFTAIFLETRRSARITLEKETSEAASRVKQEALEQRLALQEQLLRQEHERTEQQRLITALASDYRSVYYLDLDRNEGVCYQAYEELESGLRPGEHFAFIPIFSAYAEKYVTESYRADFLHFIQPESIRQGLAEENVISFRYTVNRGGRELYEMVRFASVRSTDGHEDKAVHAVGACFTDVDAETRRSLAQSEFLSTALTAAEEASRAKTAFLSSMSHEIRTPMNAIIGLNTIAMNDAETPEKTRGYLEKIGASAEHLLYLINDILDMSRIESGKVTLKNEEFSFPGLLETINTMFSGQCQEKGLDYQCRILSAVDEWYIGDSMKLKQVLINILSNAVKFTPEGGQILFSVERTACFDGKSTLCFTVQDTGIGMSEDFLPHLFDAFAQEDSSTTNRYGSSGLGMAITRSFVEMMNGNIRVESEKGSGTTFFVTVTLTDTSGSEDARESGQIAPRDMSVLVVDDDPIACEHARLVLEKAGITAETVLSGAAAVEQVKLRQARQKPYDLILVDWKMPGMDGVETTRRIRAVAGSSSAIIILTAYRWDEVLEDALAAGVDSFISKPLFATTVLDEFNQALHRRGISKEGEVHRAELAGRKVLLAEDVAVNTEIMVMMLGMRNIETDPAENGRIAVEKFAAQPAGTYDAILMDMRMPEMDGLEATRRIRAMDRPDAKTIPIIALTANAFDEDVQRSLQAGLDAHLSKPVEPEALFETLEKLIRG